MRNKWGVSAMRPISRLRAFGLAAGLFVGLAGCGASQEGEVQVRVRPAGSHLQDSEQTGDTAAAKTAPAPTAAGASAATPAIAPIAAGDLQQVDLDKLVLALTPGQPLVRKTGLMCGRGGNVEPDQPGEHAYEDLAQSARKGLAKSGIPVPDTSSLFGTSSGATFLLRGRATEVDFGYCAFWYVTELEGSLTVTWELFSLLEQRVVYRGSSSGSAVISGGSPAEAGILGINSAVELAASRLGNDPQFRAALAQDPATPRVAAQPAGGPIHFTARPPFTGGFQSQAGQVTQATALLRGRGHGSGFFISADGLLLTNAHVVQGQTRIRVELADGRVLTGEVLRSNAGRDVALVRVPIAGAVALPLDRTLPQVGDEAYASGAPLDAALSGTITRGIVSAIRRDDDGTLWIQADVDVQPGNSGGPLLDGAGNVIGITTFGLQPEGSSIGLNFFLPIDQALTALDLHPR